ncbi:hypothetical protein CLV40_117123 [Actinokineospora auranticolor]|uniref:Uncharacterized protein n=1 Tax=Actinokineospora auranticolor TaxID=155976 RepID=A0A2S6GI28_9PSEU|nr:hypothetical protein CLV40_117123 [Actinokineospora auranticolor]
MVVLGRQWWLTLFWAFLTLLCPLFVLATYQDLHDRADPVFLGTTVVATGLALWCANLVRAVGPVRIKDGRLTCTTTWRHHRIEPAEISGWRWVRPPRSSLARFLGLSYLAVKLVDGQVLPLRWHLVRFPWGTGTPAHTALLDFLGAEKFSSRRVPWSVEIG